MLHEKTRALEAKAKGRKACCPAHTAAAFNDYLALLEEARQEAGELRRLYREVSAVEDPRAMGALNELLEKIRALDYHIPRVEEGVERLQGVLEWMDRELPRVFDSARERLEEGEAGR